MDLKGRDFLKLLDFTPEEILFDLSDSIRYDFYSAFLPAAALKVSAMLAMPCSSAGSRMVVA